MKKILLVTAMIALGAQFVYGEIVQGNFETSASVGANIPLGYSESDSHFFGYLFDENAFSSAGVGLDANLQTVYGINNNNGLGVGIGVLSTSMSASDNFKNFNSIAGLSSPPSTMTVIPIYALYKYEFENTQFTPFLLAKLGCVFPITKETSSSFNDAPFNDPYYYPYYGYGSFKESYSGGLYLGAGAGMYVTQDVFLEADLNFYQTTMNLTENFDGINYSSHANMNFFTTGLQVGYTF